MEYFASQWKKYFGIELSIQFGDYGKFFDYIETTRPNIWLMGWTADYPDPDSFLRYDPWTSQSGWRSERYDSIMQGARRITDQERRMELYRQAELILVDEAPVVPVYYNREHVLVKPWIPGLRASIITGNILKDIVIEPH